MHTSHSMYCYCSMHPLPFAPLLPTCGLLHLCCFMHIIHLLPFFLSYILRSVCTHFFSLVLIINAFTHSLVPAPCSTAPLVLLLGIHFPQCVAPSSFSSLMSLMLSILSSTPSSLPLYTSSPILILLSPPSSSSLHLILFFTLSSFFPFPFLHSPCLLYLIIHIWHHLCLAFFCNIMVICSFCVTSDHVIILNLICDAKYVSIFLLLSLF